MAIELTKDETINCLHICRDSSGCTGCKLKGTDYKNDRNNMMCSNYLMKKAEEYLINETNKGEEKMEFKAANTEKRTKAELLDEIKKLKGEVEKLERFKAYEDQAGELKGMYDSYINAGFTEEQAFEIVKIMLSKVKF